MSWVDCILDSDNKLQYSRFTRDIYKPDTDDREYRVIELGNELRAVLAHDPSADRAAGSLTITVGALLDPVSAWLKIHEVI